LQEYHDMRRRLFVQTLIVSGAAAFSILGMLTAAKAQDVGDVQRGLEIAADICAACHAVRPGAPRSPVVTAPTFDEIAHTSGMTSIALTVWLTAHSHPTMPNLILRPQQVRDVSAYILSLQGTKP
jgi:mono/diheme cytochrome c family protein